MKEPQYQQVLSFKSLIANGDEMNSPASAWGFVGFEFLGWKLFLGLRETWTISIGVVSFQPAWSASCSAIRFTDLHGFQICGFPAVRESGVRVLLDISMAFGLSKGMRFVWFSFF